MADPLQTDIQVRDIPEYLRDYRSALLNAAFQSVFSKPFLEKNFPSATWYTGGAQGQPPQAPPPAAGAGGAASAGGGDTRTDTQVPESEADKAARGIAGALAMSSGQMPKILGMVWDPKTRTYVPEKYKPVVTMAGGGDLSELIDKYAAIREQAPSSLKGEVSEYAAPEEDELLKSILSGAVQNPSLRGPFGELGGGGLASSWNIPGVSGSNITGYNPPPDVSSGGGGSTGGGDTGGTGGGTGGGNGGGGGVGSGGGGRGPIRSTGGGGGVGVALPPAPVRPGAGVTGAPPIGTPASAAVLPQFSAGPAGTTPESRGAGGYNPAQYATDQQAAGLASLLGSKVSSTNPIGPGAPPPQNILDFGDGAQLNAGLVQQALGNITVDGVSRARTPSEMTQSLAGLRAEIAAGGGDTSEIDRLIQQNAQAYTSGATTSPVGRSAEGGSLAQFEIGDDGKVKNYRKGGAIRKFFGGGFGMSPMGGFGSPQMGGFGGGFSGMGQQSFPSSIPASVMQVPSGGGFSPFLASMLRSGSNAYSSSLGGVSGPVSLESMGFQPDKPQNQGNWDTHPFLKGIPKPDANTFNNPNAQRPGESWIDHEKRVTSGNQAATPGPIASSIDPASFGGMSRGDTPVAPMMADMSESQRQNIMSAIGGGGAPMDGQQPVKPTGRMPQAMAQPGLPVGPGTDQLGQPQVLDNMGGYRMPQMGGYGFPMSGIMGGYSSPFMGGMGGYGYPMAGGMGGYGSPFMGGMGRFRGYGAPMTGGMGYGSPFMGGMGGYGMPSFGGIGSLMQQFGGGMNMPTYTTQMGFHGGPGQGQAVPQMQTSQAQSPTRPSTYRPSRYSFSEGGSVRLQGGGSPNLGGFGAPQTPASGGFGGPGGAAGFWNMVNPDTQVGTSMFNAPPVYGGQRNLMMGGDFGQYDPQTGYTVSNLTRGALGNLGNLPSVFGQLKGKDGQEYTGILPGTDFGKGVRTINRAADIAGDVAEAGAGLIGQLNAPEQQSYLMEMMDNISKMGIGSPISISQLNAPQMEMPTGVTAGRTRVGEFGTPQAEQYMSPYQRAVTDTQKREAQRQAAMQKAGRSAAAVRAGAFGGSRQAIQEGMAEEALQRQLGDIEAAGTQRAFESAQAQFERDRAASLASQQANLRANLEAQLANQQAGLTAGQANLGAALGTQQLGTQAGLEAAKANQAAALGISQMQLDAIKQASAERQQARQQAFGNKLAALQQAQAGASGMAGMGGTLMGIPGAAQQLELQRLASMQQGGGYIDALTRQAMDLQYQDFINQQNYPYQQMNFLSGILGGVPTGMQVEGVQFARPAGGGLSGLLTSGAGLLMNQLNK